MYSHRSTYLHAMAVMAASVEGITEADRAMAIVPMFHANAWGMPYAAFLSGATLQMPGPFLQPEHLTAFIATERTTVTSGVPTIWNAIFNYGEDHAIDLSSLRIGNSGGSARRRTWTGGCGRAGSCTGSRCGSWAPAARNCPGTA